MHQYVTSNMSVKHGCHQKFTLDTVMTFDPKSDLDLEFWVVKNWRFTITCQQVFIECFKALALLNYKRDKPHATDLHQYRQTRASLFNPQVLGA